MSFWMPGAVHKPLHINFTNRQRAVTDAVVLHVAAGEAASLHGWFSNPQARASSHFYVRRDGTVEQYVAIDRISWAGVQSDNRAISIETQGLGHGEWTAAQVASIIKIIRFCQSKFPSIPSRLMQSSKRSEKGIGWHALGVPASYAQKNQGVSQTGGELWSGAPGKICPGPDRIKQIPGIVKALQSAAGSSSASAPVAPPTKPTPTPTPALPTLEGIEKVVQDMKATHIIFEFQEGRGTALAIANVLAGTWTRFGSTDDYKARLTVLKRSGAKVEEWKTFKTGKNPNNIASPAAFGVEVKA